MGAKLLEEETTIFTDYKLVAEISRSISAHNKLQEIIEIYLKIIIDVSLWVFY